MSRVRRKTFILADTTITRVINYMMVPYLLYLLDKQNHLSPLPKSRYTAKVTITGQIAASAGLSWLAIKTTAQRCVTVPSVKSFKEALRWRVFVNGTIPKLHAKCLSDDVMRQWSVHHLQKIARNLKKCILCTRAIFFITTTLRNYIDSKRIEGLTKNCFDRL